MRIFYPFGFHPGATSGGTAHIRQFIAHVEREGDAVITLRGDVARGDPGYPRGRLARWRTLRGVDVIYERLEHRAPAGGWYRSPQRRLIGSPVVAWELNTVPEFGAVLGASEAEIELERRTFRRLAARCDVAFCVSRELTAYAKSELGLTHAVTVPNGSDSERFAPGVEPVFRLRAQSNLVHAVWMGSADLTWHDFELLRGVATRLWETLAGRNVALHVLGQGLRDAGELPPNVHYHGAVPYDELPRWLAGCQIGLIAYRPGPARYSSPLKLFDYLAAGLAVVSTEQPQVRELLEPIGGGDLIAPIGDAGAFAAVLLRLASDPARRVALSAAGRELIAARYTWRHTAQTIRGELQTLLRAQSSA